MRARKSRSIQSRIFLVQASNSQNSGLKIRGNVLSIIKNKYLLIALKLIVSSTLVYFLVSKIGGSTIINNIRILNPAAFIAAICLYIFQIFLSSMRWGLLIPYRISRKRLFSLYMTGAFFNAYMPGLVGGDAVKAFYLSRELKNMGEETRGEGHGTADVPEHNIVALTSVFMDRYVGFCALLLIGMTALPFGITYLEGAVIKWPVELPVTWVIPSISVMFISFSIIVLRFRIGSRFGFIYRLYEHFNFYNSRKTALVKALVYSVFIQFTGILSVYILSRGLSLQIPFLSVLIFLPIVVLISTLPISISGIGLREGAFVFLFGTIGVKPEMSATLSVVWFLSVVTAGLLGLLSYLRQKSMFGGKIEE